MYELIYNSVSGLSHPFLMNINQLAQNKSLFTVRVNAKTIPYMASYNMISYAPVVTKNNKMCNEL